jgi:hypothetical protein
MDVIISQIQTLAKDANEQTRKSILTALHTIGQAIETPDDTVTRIWGGVSAAQSILGITVYLCATASQYLCHSCWHQYGYLQPP